MQTETSLKRRVIAMAGVVLGLLGILCLGTVVASAVLNLGDFRELLERSRSLGGAALLGFALIIVGLLMMGRTHLCVTLDWLERDCAPSLWPSALHPSAPEPGTPSVVKTQATESSESACPVGK